MHSQHRRSDKFTSAQLCSLTKGNCLVMSLEVEGVSRPLGDVLSSLWMTWEWNHCQSVAFSTVIAQVCFNIGAVGKEGTAQGWVHRVPDLQFSHSWFLKNGLRAHGQQGYAVDMGSQNACERFLNASAWEINLKWRVLGKGSGDKIGYSHKCRKLLVFSKLSEKGCGELKE